MRWAWKLGQVSGIEIRIHATFLLLLLWIGLAYYAMDQRWQSAAVGVLFILALFTTVVMHELGHALVAQHFGIRTFDITLLPIGGVARLERIPERPRQELLVALAGPAVNLVLGGLLLAAIGGPLARADLKETLHSPAAFFLRLGYVNLCLALFNLIPAFPMDGGRALRALLATRMDYARATQAAAHLGQGLALCFAALGLLFNPVLLFIAFFVWISASQENAATQLKASLEGIPVARAMVTEFQTFAPEDPLALPAARLLQSFQHDFPVCRDGALLGLLTHRGLVDALGRLGDQAPISQAMEEKVETADPAELLSAALPRLSNAGSRAMPVVRDGKVVGLLTLDNLGEMVMLHAAMQPRGARSG